MRATRWMTLLLLALLLAGAPVHGDDPPAPETPEERAERIKLLGGQAQLHLATAQKGDTVETGNALEAIALAGNDLSEVKVDGLLEGILDVGIATKERFITVLAGEIGFMRIPELIEQALSEHEPGDAASLGEVEQADAWARECVRQHL